MARRFDMPTTVRGKPVQETSSSTRFRWTSEETHHFQSFARTIAPQRFGRPSQIDLELLLAKLSLTRCTGIKNLQGEDVGIVINKKVRRKLGDIMHTQGSFCRDWESNHRQWVRDLEGDTNTSEVEQTSELDGDPGPSGVDSELSRRIVVLDLGNDGVASDNADWLFSQSPPSQLQELAGGPMELDATTAGLQSHRTELPDHIGDCFGTTPVASVPGAFPPDDLSPNHRETLYEMDTWAAGIQSSLRPDSRLRTAEQPLPRPPPPIISPAAQPPLSYSHQSSNLPPEMPSAIEDGLGRGEPAPGGVQPDANPNNTLKGTGSKRAHLADLLQLSGAVSSRYGDILVNILLVSVISTVLPKLLSAV